MNLYPDDWRMLFYKWEKFGMVERVNGKFVFTAVGREHAEPEVLDFLNEMWERYCPAPH